MKTAGQKNMPKELVVSRQNEEKLADDHFWNVNQSIEDAFANFESPIAYVGVYRLVCVKKVSRGGLVITDAK